MISLVCLPPEGVASNEDVGQKNTTVVITSLGSMYQKDKKIKYESSNFFLNSDKPYNAQKLRGWLWYNCNLQS